jgi:hypothetical protein
MATTTYERDFYRWTQEQAGLLRAGRLGEVDVEHLIEEIESMGRSEKRELLHRLTVLIAHLLKWRFQPALRSRSWSATIKEQRKMLAIHLEDNPSLKAQLEETARRAYEIAMLSVERETGLEEKSFPAECPFSLDQLLDHQFMPD